VTRLPSLTLLALTLLLAAPSPGLAAPSDPQDSARGLDLHAPLELRIKPLPSGVRKVRLEPDGADGHVYVLTRLDGSEERVRPDELASRLYDESRQQSWLMRLLNITSPAGMAWVALGLLGQLLFTGRMILQWLVSERSRRSVVPVGFWWMSLVGATMLLAYFLWRRDIVGVLGQAAGWIVYIRNLWLIYREHAPESA